jgi:hypothetical protein
LTTGMQRTNGLLQNEIKNVKLYCGTTGGVFSLIVIVLKLYSAVVRQKTKTYLLAWVLLHAAALVLSVWGCAVLGGIAEQGLVVKVKVKMRLKCSQKRYGRSKRPASRRPHCIWLT